MTNTKTLSRRWHQFPSIFPDDVFNDLEKAMFALDWFNPELNSMSFKGFPKGDAFINKDGKCVIELLLAGYSKDDLSVEVEGDILKVSATKANGDDHEGQRMLARRAFSKSYVLNSKWDLNSVEVTHKDGVLRIVVAPVGNQNPNARKLEIK